MDVFKKKKDKELGILRKVARTVTKRKSKTFVNNCGVKYVIKLNITILYSFKNI